MMVHFSLWNALDPRYHIGHFISFSILKSCYWQWFTVTVRSFTSNPNGSDNSGSHILGMNFKGTGTLREQELLLWIFLLKFQYFQQDNQIFLKVLSVTNLCRNWWVLDPINLKRELSFWLERKKNAKRNFCWFWAGKGFLKNAYKCKWTMRNLSLCQRLRTGAHQDVGVLAIMDLWSPRFRP